MTTAQQLGLVGNSVRVQALPTASAETFGQGNRYYTLIGQQEGYITGHTYHTVVANDVYSWEDVAQAGPQGEDGKDYLIMIKHNITSSVPKVGNKVYNNWSMDSFNRQVFENDKGFTVMNCTSDKKQYAVIFNCTGVTTTHVGYITYTSVSEITGATGQQGPAGTTVYNNLSDIPVINQDLSASGFTPVANTYYRHTGTTTPTFTQGVIYLYDTEYKALDGSGGGGTTLNKYTYSIGKQTSQSALERVRRIVDVSKTAPRARFIMSSDWQWHEIVNVNYNGYFVITRCYENSDSVKIVETDYIWGFLSDSFTAFKKSQNIDTGEITTTKNDYAYGTNKLEIVYYNDVEIT